jgi:hypothetical protein
MASNGAIPAWQCLAIWGPCKKHVYLSPPGELPVWLAQCAHAMCDLHLITAELRLLVRRGSRTMDTGLVGLLHVHPGAAMVLTSPHQCIPWRDWRLAKVVQHDETGVASQRGNCTEITERNGLCFWCR